MKASSLHPKKQANALSKTASSENLKHVEVSAEENNLQLEALEREKLNRTNSIPTTPSKASYPISSDENEGMAVDGSKPNLIVEFKDFPQILNFIPITAEQIGRESLIKKHFEGKLAQLTQQLQIVDSQAMKFQHETSKLKKSLKDNQEERQQLTLKLNQALKRSKEIQEKLETVEKGYSSQLNLMTEHICTLNAKIAEMDEQKEKKRTK